MTFKSAVGRIIYRSFGQAKHLWGGSKNCFRIRRLCGKLIFEKCGGSLQLYRGGSFSGRIFAGDRVHMGENMVVLGTLYLGNDVVIARDVKFYSINHCTARVDIPINQQGDTKDRPVYIGDDVWIGANVIVLPGVHVGKGAVLGAGCVVREDVPEYAVMIGNPAQVLRYRNASSEMLLK